MKVWNWILSVLKKQSIFTRNSFLAGTDVLVRLADGDATSGRVEILYEDQWGTLCHDYFSDTDAKVICRQLGFPEGNHIAKSGGYFPAGIGNIWIDDLSCSGSEQNIHDCNFPGWDVHNCNHNEDAGVICDPGKLLIYQY